MTRRFVRIALLVWLAAAEASPDAQTNRWIVGVRALLEDCPVKSARLERLSATPSHEFVGALADCARRRAWMLIDEMLEEDVIPVVSGLDLVRMQEARKPRIDEAVRSDNESLVFNVRSLLKRIQESSKSEHRDYEDEDSTSWREKLTSRLNRVLKTHVIKIDLERLRPTIPNATIGRSSSSTLVEARGRRRRRRQMQMLPIIMMGVLLMGSVLIPMGFQFLAVLGGKALILAKMALMLSSIQGLKKIATSGVNYGLYHTPVPEPWHERSNGLFEVPYSAGYLGDAAALTGHFARRVATASIQPT